MEIILHGKWQRQGDKYQLILKPFLLEDGTEVIGQTPSVETEEQIAEGEKLISKLYSSVTNYSESDSLARVKNMETPHLASYIKAGMTDGKYGVVRDPRRGTISLAIATPSLDSLDKEAQRKIIKAPGKFMSRSDKKGLLSL